MLFLKFSPALLLLNVDHALQQLIRTPMRQLMVQFKMPDWLIQKVNLWPLQGLISLLLVMDLLVLALGIIFPASSAVTIASDCLFFAVSGLLIFDIISTFCRTARSPWNYFKNFWNWLDLLSLVMLLTLPFYRYAIFLRFGRVLRAAGPGRVRSMVKSVQLARELWQRLWVSQQLQDREALWDLMARSANDGLWEWKPTTGEFALSPRWRELRGFQATARSVSRERWGQLIHGADRDRVLAQFERYLAGEMPFFQVEYRGQQRDGSYRWFQCRALALRDRHGRATVVLGAETDISALKASQEETARHLETLQKIFDRIPLVLALCDGEGRIEFVNRTFEQLLGPATDAPANADADAAPQRWEDIFQNPRDRPEHWPQGTWHGRRVLSRNGHYLNTLWTTVTLSDGRNIVLGEDITARRRAEEQLAVERELAQVTLQSIGDAVIVLDDQRRIQEINPMAERTLGWSREEARGKGLEELLQLFDADGATAEPLTVAMIAGGGGLSGRYRLVSRQGHQCIADLSCAPLRDRAGGMAGQVLVLRDVTEAHYLEQELMWQATHDVLTGLLNRQGFDAQLRSAIATVRQTGIPQALACLSLDWFAIVDTTCGHDASTRLMERLGSFLKQQFPTTATIGRLYTDEFGILLPERDFTKAVALLEACRKKLAEERFYWHGAIYTLSASIGLVPIERNSSTLEVILGAADAACQAARREGPGHLKACQADDSQILRWQTEQQWIARINSALAENRFCLYTQSIAPLGSPGSPPISEVLLRMIDEVGQEVSPGQFMPAAERYNLMPEIDRWVVDAFFAAVESRGADLPDRIYTINLSGSSLNSNRFFAFLKERITNSQFPKHRLCFEVTETTAIANLGRSARFMEEIRTLGCSFALDDFGSGMSSLMYLKSLPVDYLKIDGSFVRDIDINPVDRTMVESCHRIAHAMGLETIAEFVERDTVVEALLAMGIDYAQGFAVSRMDRLTVPLPLEQDP
ncbi:MAG: hypothetical protein Fur0042_19550 [Cyanophyceae cyanobacterium]